MSDGSYKQANFVCPYYVSDNARSKIYCEGIIPDTILQNVFRSIADYRTQIDTFCSGCYWMCEICAALDKKYED